MSSNYDWDDIPLCRAYRFAEFMAVPVPIGQSGSVNEDSVLVAVGFTADGQYEALGAWQGTDAWLKALKDLRHRGTEILRLVRRQGLRACDETLSALYGQAVVVTTAPGKGKKLIDDFPIAQFRSRLNRAIRRRGTFADLEAAASFVANELRRIEFSIYVASVGMGRSRRVAPIAASLPH